LRLTVARYYTPSGRLIQTEYEDGDRTDYYASKALQKREDGTQTAAELLTDVPDSLQYRTSAGRLVIAGGGIIPDYIVPPDSLSPLMRAVIGRSLENQFIRSWVDLYGPSIKQTYGESQEPFVAGFSVGDDMAEAFYSFAAERGVVIGDRTTSADVQAEFTAQDLARDEDMIHTLLKGRLGTRLYDRSAWYPIWRQVDHLLIESQKLWGPARDLASSYSSAR